MLVAKPVVPNQFWILREDNKKVGNIEAGPQGFSVKINNNVTNYKSLKILKKLIPVSFEPTQRAAVSDEKNQVNGFPTASRPYNPVLDVKHQLPLYTKEDRSRSWYAAGWYRIQQHRDWEVIQCPKLILLQRYTFKGPFKTRYEAELDESAH